MPISIHPPKLELEVSDKPREVTVVVRLDATAARPVTIIRPEPGPGLGNALTALDSYPITLKADVREVPLRFRLAPDPLQNELISEIGLVVEEAELTGIRSIGVRLSPDRLFTGVFAIDLGGASIAAAFIDRAAGQQDPQLLKLGGTQPDMSTTFTARFGDQAATPTLVPLSEYLQRTDAQPEVYFRPRRFLTQGGTRPARPYRAAVQELDSLGWLLSDILKRAGRHGPGRPREVYLPLPGGLRPEQVAAFHEAIARIPELADCVHSNLGGRSPGWLDEASAAAFHWLWEKCEVIAGKNVKILVLDVGADSVELAVLSLQLKRDAGGRLEATPHLEVRDGFPLLCGDRVTAAVFRHLKHAVVDKLLEKRSRGATSSSPDDRDEEILPTRWHNRVGAEHRQRLHNFNALWNAAEEVKKALGDKDPLEVRVVGLHPQDQAAGVDVAILLAAGPICTELDADVRKCKDRILSDLIATNTGERFRIDQVLLTGGASQLPLFRKKIWDPLFEWLQGEEKRVVGVSDYGKQSKKLVAHGMALAVYARNYAPPIGTPGATGRLAMAIDRFDLRLPFNIAYQQAGGKYELLFERGSEFELNADKQPQPLQAVGRVAYRPKLSLFRFANQRLESHHDSLGEANLEATLDQGDDGSTATVEVFLRPDLSVEARCNGRVAPMTPHVGREIDPLENLW